MYSLALFLNRKNKIIHGIINDNPKQNKRRENEGNK